MESPTGKLALAGSECFFEPSRSNFCISPPGFCLILGLCWATTIFFCSNLEWKMGHLAAWGQFCYILDAACARGYFQKIPFIGWKNFVKQMLLTHWIEKWYGLPKFSIQLTTIMKIPTPGYQMSHDIFINIFTRSSLPRLKSRPYSPERFKSAQLWSNVMLGIRITLLLSQS